MTSQRCYILTHEDTKKIPVQPHPPEKGRSLSQQVYNPFAWFSIVLLQQTPL